MHQSCPGERRRRVSQPSIHLPVRTYSSFSTGSAARTRFSRLAKSSSLAAMTAPPTRSLARSMYWDSAMGSISIPRISDVVDTALLFWRALPAGGALELDPKWRRAAGDEPDRRAVGLPPRRLDDEWVLAGGRVDLGPAAGHRHLTVS